MSKLQIFSDHPDKANTHICRCLFKMQFESEYFSPMFTQDFEYFMCWKFEDWYKQISVETFAFQQRQGNGKSFQVWQQSQIPSLLGLSWHICWQKSYLEKLFQKQFLLWIWKLSGNANAPLATEKWSFRIKINLQTIL